MVRRNQLAVLSSTPRQAGARQFVLRSGPLNLAATKDVFINSRGLYLSDRGNLRRARLIHFYSQNEYCCRFSFFRILLFFL
jgi:hypothetical protein